MVDQTETGDENEETPGYPQGGDDGEISYGGACLENYHPIHLEETSVLDHDRGQDRVIDEGGPANPDDAHGGALKIRWRTESPWSLATVRQEGRKEQSLPAFDFQ